MSVTTSELSLTYGTITIGGSTARQITEWTKDEHDYERGAFEFEFITTAASDAAFKTELDTIRDEFRKPRLDLVVTQNSQNILSRKHSDNTGLDTAPYIIKDGDPADTGRSRHFRVRIEYELPADNVSTSFRRGATIRVEYSESRRRTVTITGVYTANSTDGTTTADAQYFAQIATAEDTLLDTVDSSATWERTGQPQVEYFETRKLVQFTRVYREVNQNQATDTIDDTDIINPFMTISREEMSPGDSLEGGLNFGAGSGGAGGSGGGGSSTVLIPTGTGSPPAAGPAIKRPILVTVNYNTSIAFSNTNLQEKWQNTIRPWLIERARSNQGNGGVIIIDEKVEFDFYENRITAILQCIAYSTTIIKQLITYRELLIDGYVLAPTTSNDRFSFYEYAGPATRQMIVDEEREEIVANGTTAGAYITGLYSGPGASESGLGEKWRRISREPQANMKTQGLGSIGQKTIATAKITTVFQFRNKKSPSVANAGGITGVILTG